MIGTSCFQDEVLVHEGTKSQRENRTTLVQGRFKDKGSTINQFKSGNTMEKSLVSVSQFQKARLSPLITSPKNKDNRSSSKC